MNESFEVVECKNMIEKDQMDIVIMYDPMNGQIFQSSVDTLKRACKAVNDRTSRQPYLENLDV